MSDLTGHAAGEFVSQRPFDSVWNTDICLFDCLVHQIFNLTSPKTSPGKLSINDTARVVNASVLADRTGVAYVGDSFGCQLQLVNQVGIVHIHKELCASRTLSLNTCTVKLPHAKTCFAVHAVRLASYLAANTVHARQLSRRQNTYKPAGRCWGWGADCHHAGAGG